MKTPVYYENRIVEMATPARVKVLATAPNVQVVRARKTREIVRLIFLQVLDEGERCPREDSRKAEYEESLQPAPIVMLKVIAPDGSMRRWGPEDVFRTQLREPGKQGETVTKRGLLGKWIARQRGAFDPSQSVVRPRLQRGDRQLALQPPLATARPTTPHA